MKRRGFIQSAATAAMAAPLAASVSRPVLGANERVNVGLIGCGGRGRYVGRIMQRAANTRIVAVCDVYQAQFDAAREMFEIQDEGYRDFRNLLERKDIDAVLIATPDHWHAIPTVLACEAEKDVYVEKPLALTINEGKAMVASARRNQRIVQTGLQQRSAPHFEEIGHILQSGELGQVHYIRIWNFRNLFPNGIGFKPDSDPPPGLDWDFYLGPAPEVRFNWNRFLRTYRYFWDYSGGVITDFGAHRFDSMHQVMGVDAPETVSATGGRFALEDGGEVPEILQATYRYPGFVVSYEACLLNGHGVGGRTPGRMYYNAIGESDRPNGLAFYGTNGALFADRFGFEIYPEPAATRETASAGQRRMERKEAQGRDATAEHVENFIECVRSRKTPKADIETGHRSTIVAHLGNIAFHTRRTLTWDGSKQEIAGDETAAAMMGRTARKPWDWIGSL